MAAVYICEVCCEPLPSEAEVKQHSRSCINPKRQPRVQLQRLTKEQLLTHRVPSEQISDWLKKCNKLKNPICKLECNDLTKVQENGDVCAISQATYLEELKNKLKAGLNFPCDAPAETSFFRPLHTQKIHKHKSSSDTTLSCHICGKVLKFDHKLEFHLKRHKTPTDGIFNCLYKNCNKPFPESEFKMHIQQHKNRIRIQKEPLSYKCEHCGQNVQSELLLTTHVNRHFL